MSELKCCPFCGGSARISCDTEATRDSQGRLWAFTVVCDSCCATSGLGYSPEMIKEKWKRRIPMANIVEKLEEIKGKACDGIECVNCVYNKDCYEGEMSEVVAIDKAINIVTQEINNGLE